MSRDVLAAEIWNAFVVAYRLSPRKRALQFLLLISTALTPAAVLAQSASSVETFPGYVTGISSDGSVVVGGVGQSGYAWVNGVATNLGTLGGSTSVNGVSGNGATVVGYSIDSNIDQHAFAWSGGVMTDLGVLPGAGAGGLSNAYGASFDGSVIVGLSSSAAGIRAFRWTGGVMSDLGTLGGNSSTAYGVSGDGNVVVGYSNTGTENHAFRWTGGVMTDLGTLGGTSSIALAVSANGNVVVGRAAIAGDAETHAFRWAGGVMTDLGLLNPGDSFSWGRAVSADGSVVVGLSYGFPPSGTQSAAFRWTAATGMQSVATLLRNSGLNLGGLQLADATGVSGDGSVIVGRTSTSQAYIARLGSGLIMMPDQMSSFSSLGAVGQTATASLGTNFATVTSQATQAGTSNASGKPFSVFSAMGYDSDPTVSGTLGGTAKLNDRGLIVGTTFGADNIRTTNMNAGGSAKMNAGTFGLFVAQVPEVGWQALVGGNAIYLNGKISRGYANGVTPVTSTGSTFGKGYGLTGRVGYTFAGVLPKTQITPFASYNYTHVSFAGYTETDGPFPAVMNSFRDIQQVSRIGADARYTLRQDTWLWGTLAWGHRLDAGKSSDVSGTLIGLFPIATSGGTTTRRDWAEVTGGVRYGAWKDGAVTASLTANLPDRGVVNYVAHLGVSQAF